MKSCLHTLCAALIGTMTSQAGVIYSTLGSSSPDYDANHGMLITGSSTPAGEESIAVPFVPSADCAVTFIDLALIYVSGTNSATVELRADSSDAPGDLLGSWTVSAVPHAYAEVGISASGRLRAG